MKVSEATRQISAWRHEAKVEHGLTDAELAKKIGCSASVLTHKAGLYRMPFYQAMKLKELAERRRE